MGGEREREKEGGWREREIETERGGETDREADIDLEINRQKDRNRGNQRGRERETDRQTDRQTDRMEDSVKSIQEYKDTSMSLVLYNYTHQYNCQNWLTQTNMVNIRSVYTHQ